MGRLSWIFAIYLGLVHIQIQAQNYYSNPDIQFDRYSVSQGLSHIAVNSITQDSWGFIWIGTYDGLNRFDGTNFKVFKRVPDDSTTLINNRVHCIIEHSSGKLFIGTEEGLCLYNRRLEIFEKTGLGCIDGQKIFVTRLFEDSLQRLWILTRTHGLWVTDPIKNSCKKISIIGRNDVSSLQFNDICEDPKGNMWIATSSDLLCLNADLLPQEYCIIGSIKPNTINAINCYGDKHFWIAQQDGLYRLNLNYRSDTINLEVISHLLHGQNITSNLLDSKGYLWAGSLTNGLYRFIFMDNKIKRIEQFRNNLYSEKSLSSDFVYCLFEGNRGGIWIGTPEKGLCRYDPDKEQVQIINQKNGLESDYVTVLCKYDSVTVLCGLRKNGINVYHTGKNKIIDPWFKSSPINRASIYSFFKDSRGILWIGTDQGLYYLPPKIKDLIYSDELSRIIENNDFFKGNNIIFDIAEDDAHFIWIGTNCGLYRLSIDEDSKINGIHNFNYSEDQLSEFSSLKVKTIYNDPLDESIWIGTFYNGLYRFRSLRDERKIQEFIIENFRYQSNFSNSLRSNFVSVIFRDSRNILWCGTEGGGFSRFVDGSSSNYFIHYTELEGLSNNVVKAIIEDPYGDLYISTNDKLNIFKPRSGEFSYLDDNYGLASNYFTSAAVGLDDGRLIFGGNEGIAILTPWQNQSVTIFPTPHFGSFQVYYKTVHPGEIVNNRVILRESLSFLNKIELRHNQNIFAIELISIDFSMSENQRYKYRLKGYDENWIYTRANNNLASYTKVPYGEYYFEFYTSNKNGEWTEEPRRLAITIDTPFWLTGWAFGIYTIIFISLILGIYFYLCKIQQLRNNVHLEMLEKNKEHELTEAKLNFFTNISHEFRTPLTLISGPVENLLMKFKTNDTIRYNLLLIKNQANYLLRLLEQLLEFRKIEKDQLNLKCHKNDIVEFLWQLKNAFNGLAVKKNIQFKFVSQIPHIDLWFDPKMIEKVFYNLLSNAFKYTPEYGEISIQIEKENKDSICVKVSDTGPGIPEDEQEKVFERFYQSRSHDQVRGTGIGLSLSRTLIELHGGSIHVQKHGTMGAELVVILPLGRDHLTDADTTEGGPAIPSEIYMDLEQYENPSIYFPVPEMDITKKPKMYIVEDSREMSDFIRDMFSREYEVFQYENGRIALDRMKSITPDIVISDVLMPVMDGIELCRKMKSDVTISHIPIILLTSRQELNSKIRGLNFGADDYICKPFPLVLLNARVKNLLGNKSRMKSRYSQEFVEEHLTDKYNESGREFLCSLTQVIEEHISSAAFDNFEFSKAMDISIAKLYREIKKTTGNTPNELIRNYRIKKAVQLLLNEDLPVTEISDMLGFRSRTYFHKCFKKAHNITPAVYRRLYRKKHSLSPITI